MAEQATAKLFRHGGSQAVRLPKEFRFAGERVKITRMGRGVLIEPEEFDARAWLRDLRAAQDDTFMEGGRDQPPMPPDRDIFD